MNLNEAYLGWQQVKDNGQFYMKTRNDFRRAWLMLPTNKPCSYYTKEVLGEALAASSEAEGVKVRAASVMIQVLQWAHDQEPKESPKVEFTIDDLMAYMRGEVEKPKPKKENKPAKSEEPKPAKAEGEKKHPGGRPTKRVCQIDPETLEVIATFDSCNAAIQATGATNIDRAIARVRKSAGFYWSSPEDVKTFAKRLREKQKEDSQRHIEAANRAREAKMKKIAEQKAERAAESGEAIGGDTRGQAPVSSATDTASQSPCVAQRHDEPEGKPMGTGSCGTTDPRCLSPRLPQPKVERKPEPKAVDDSRQSKVSEALAVFTDDELIEELDRRGWYGVMRKVMVVELTKD